MSRPYNPEDDLAPMDVILRHRPPQRAVTVFAPDTTPPVTVVQREQLPADADVVIAGGVPVQPLLNEPLRDPSVCRGGDGRYYLTGTTGPDFHNCRTIRLWQSADLVTWQPVGVVWDVAKEPAAAWQQKPRILPGVPDSPLVWGVQAPEIHWLRDTFWIAFSINGQGTGLLRSTTGRADGPYVEHARLTTRGGDASLFVDDGAVYWVWGGGWIARLQEDLTGLAEKPRLLQPASHSQLGDAPLQVGARGAFLFKADGKYYLTAAEYFGRLFETPCDDAFVAVADNVYGPYSRRYICIPHGGGTTVFQDERGRWFGTYCGGDRLALQRDRAAIVPLVLDRVPAESNLGAWAKKANMSSAPVPLVRKRRWVVTERGPQARVIPVKLPGVEWIRDPQVTGGPEGWFYLTGTTSRVGLHAPGARLWRSRDLRHWEPLGDKHGVVWYADQWDWCAQPQMCNWDPNLGPTHRLWGGWLFYHRGTFWLTFSMSYGGSGLLRSVSGRAEGPYEPVAQVEKFGLGGGFFFDDDGAVYHTAACTEIARMKEDLTGLMEKPRRIGPASGMRYGYEGGRLMKILGKYVLFGVDWNGTDIWLEGRKGEGTYDTVYCVADRLDGPYSDPRLAVPHVGALIQGPDGEWWASTFGNANGDITAAAPCELGFIRMRVERVGDDLRIAPVEE